MEGTEHERGTEHGVAAGNGHGGEDFHLPAPSIWPLVLAGGVTLLAFGIVTNLTFSIIGLLLSAWALAGWIGELRHE